MGLSVLSDSIYVNIMLNSIFNNSIGISLNKSQSGFVSNNTIWRNNKAIQLVDQTHDYIIRWNDIFGSDASDSNGYGIYGESASRE